MEQDADAPLETLRRWADSGGVWRVVHRDADGVHIVLVTCTGDEEMGRLTSADPAVLAYVGDRSASDA